MSKIDKDTEEYGWNNIQPIYVKPTNHSPFTAPLWVFTISVVVNIIFNIIMTLSQCISTDLKF